MNKIIKDINQEIKSLESELIDLRRDFHKYPELGFEEVRTSKIVANYLAELGIEVEKNVAKTGVVGLLKGGGKGKTLLLRADMDALPINEKTGLHYSSENEGIMHACGHDGHTAILLIIAKIISKYKDLISGNIKFVFQPNEEDAGAAEMVKEGILKSPDVDGAIGLHLWSPLKTGVIGLKSGPLMAASEYFNVKLQGPGGHGGAPHKTIDPVNTATSIINRLKTIETRNFDVINEPTLITTCKLEAGDFPIVIPEEVSFAGSIRTLHPKMNQVKEKFENIVEKEAEIDGLNYEIDFKCGNRLLDNNLEMVKVIKGAVAVSRDKLTIKEKGIAVMLGEDFSEISLKVPSAFYFVGTGNANKGTDYPHHHPEFNIDEDSLKIAVKIQMLSILRYFNLI
ncbi:amidohydrolase [Halanaerobiaceae bacterium Z-7014]|uniref:Amidohydrolase n=1 Tax=Halonatronomonas betaini TaxID=2778430 RepID=A0A931ANX7_9FIRM|nr:amidohydrolase [Halonatronomonas betaini]MBF8436278.1 amidohydrolase [Halonatronomonas betaini]